MYGARMPWRYGPPAYAGGHPVLGAVVAGIGLAILVQQIMLAA